MAFTLVETMVAAAVVLIAMGAIFYVSSRCMGIVRSSHDVAVASAVLHERMQQLKEAGWEAITDSESFQDQVWLDEESGTTENYEGLLKRATVSGGDMQRLGAVESVRISAYRPIASVTPVPLPITVTRDATTATLTSLPTSLADEKMVRIDLRITWTAARTGIPHTLGLTSIYARK